MNPGNRITRKDHGANCRRGKAFSWKMRGGPKTSSLKGFLILLKEAELDGAQSHFVYFGIGY